MHNQMGLVFPLGNWDIGDLFARLCTVKGAKGYCAIVADDSCQHIVSFCLLELA